MSSAQRNLHPVDEAAASTDAAGSFALKEQVAQRLAAHRARRGQSATPAIEPQPSHTPAKARSAKIAAAVAERYAQSQSYRAFLAAEAERAIREAEAAAQVAAISAQAIADAQYQLLEELDEGLNRDFGGLHDGDGDSWSLTPPSAIAVLPMVPSHHRDGTAAPRPARRHADEGAMEGELFPLSAAPAALSTPTQGLTVRLYEEVSRPHGAASATAFMRESSREIAHAAGDEAETLALDEEIAFRQAPVFETVTPPVEIPANLIEFPRQLVAARRARPRLAEGPLREDSPAAEEPESAQLRIFEVEAAQISTAPAVETAAPEWASILLAAHPVSAPEAAAEPYFAPVPAPQPAAFGLRLMSAMVDNCIIAAALLVFVTAASMTIERFAPAVQVGLPTFGIAAAATFAFFSLLYQALFFTFGEATPGMRYARIGLCTLSDDNPTRSAMRRRIFAVVLALCPLGIGFLWAWLDEDGLGWHDRISRMYQRAY